MRILFNIPQKAADKSIVSAPVIFQGMPMAVFSSITITFTLLLLTACTESPSGAAKSSAPPGAPALRQNLSFASAPRYRDCKEMVNELNADEENVRAARAAWERQSAHSGQRSIDSTATNAQESAPAGDVLSNQQETGVDEADGFKVGADHIFVQRQDSVEVLDRSDKATSRTIKVSSCRSLTSATHGS
jgi:uncharacterized secreted protein with C-terminal beta-propeller domain